ncbi:MAG: hypothetical protein LBJ92_02270 [Holosporales bacterium]|nr:hypothetical protein [Holosporales bacterium]
MEGEPARRTGVYFDVHEDLSTELTRQEVDYGELRKKSIKCTQGDIILSTRIVSRRSRKLVMKIWKKGQ